MAEVREQDGLIFLPHPFVNHQDVETLAERADAIEVFNGRASPAANEAARTLAASLRKPCYFASDAHLSSGLASVICGADSDEPLKDAIIHGKLHAVRCSSMGRSDVVLSQLIKVVKQRDVGCAARLGRRLLRAALRR
jgi:hypothetical protein